MAATDKVRNLAVIAPANGAASDNVRAVTNAENNKRTERYDLLVRGQVDITVAGTGLSNRGSILGALRDIGYTDGGADKYVTDARLARFIGECMAPSPLPAVRLAAAGIQAATLLSEYVPMWMCAARTISPNETKYVEVNKGLQQQPFVTPLKLIAGLANGPALVGTVTNMTVDVQQRYDDLVATPPWLSIFQRPVVQNVNAANPVFRIDLRGSRYLRLLAIQQDTDQGEVADIINNVVLRGDSQSILGDQGIPFADLVASNAEEMGGALPAGYVLIDFCRYGRLSSQWAPYQDTNLRLELGVQPSVTLFNGVAATGSRVRVALVEMETTSATLPKPPIHI